MKAYENEIVHFIGGIHEYMGGIAQGQHPNGQGWYRILNPCRIYSVQKGNQTGFTVSRIWGDSKFYRKFIDIRCPDDSLVEIMVLDKEGDMWKTYHKELNRAGFDRLIAPGAADIANITKGVKRLN